MAVTISDQRKLKVAEMLGQGYSQSQIARELNIDRSAVHYIIKRAAEQGLEPNEAVKQRPNSPEVDLICYVLQTKGWTQKELADHLGFSKDVVSKWVCGSKKPGKESIKRLNELTRNPEK